MVRRSAGLLLWRRAGEGIEVLLGHPGGPIFARRDRGSWSIPKGEYDDSEDPLMAAYREFTEELGIAPPDGEVVALGSAPQRSGKVNTMWALEGDLDTGSAVSNTFRMEWPPRSGLLAEFPELDRAEWFDLRTAEDKVFPAQLPFLQRLAAHLAPRAEPAVE